MLFEVQSTVSKFCGQIRSEKTALTEMSIWYAALYGGFIFKNPYNN